jgi:hypothetical protein
LVTHYQDETFRALYETFFSILSVVRDQKERGEEDWWKGIEAGLNSISTVSEELVEWLISDEEERGKKRESFDLEKVFEVTKDWVGARGEKDLFL